MRNKISINGFMNRILLTLFTLIITLFTQAQNGVFYSCDKISNSLISSICQDKTGFIWVGTEYGLNKFDGYRFTKYFHNSNDSTTLLHNTVVCLYSDREGHMWVGTNYGLQRYDYTTDRFVTYRFPDGKRPRVSEILQLSDGRVVVGTAGYGLYEVNKGSNSLTIINRGGLHGQHMYYSHLYEATDGRLWKSGSNDFAYQTTNRQLVSTESRYGTPSDFFDYEGKTVILCRDNLVMFDNGKFIDNFFDLSVLNGKERGLRTAYKDQKGNIYIGTRANGLFWIPAKTRKLLRYEVKVSGVDMASTKIWAINGDRNGNVWVGCQQRGIIMIPSRKSLFSSWNFNDHKLEIGTYVSSISEGNNGLVWCTVQDNGVYGFDKSGNIVAHPSAPDGVEYMYRDSNNDYWLGTTHGAYAYNPYTGAASLVSDFPCYTYNTITEDKRGNIFFSAFSKGMVMYNRSTKALKTFSMNDKQRKNGKLCNDWIMDLSADKHGNVWAATSSGVCCYAPDKDSFRPYKWEVLLRDTACFAVCLSSRDDILIGTESGIFMWERKSNTLKRFPNSEALKDLVVGYIVEDAKNNIWCSTSMGIWCYDIKKRQWNSYINGSGLTSHEYVNSVGLHGDDERIFFATGGGVTSFYSYEATGHKTVPSKLMLTGFYVDGKALSALSEEVRADITKLPVTEAREFTVSYEDNTITMEFSLLDYVDADNIIYEYRINGNDEWTRIASGTNSVTFSQLPSGTYDLDVRAIVNGEVSEVAEFVIRVKAPWYATTWMYLIYFLIIMALVSQSLYLYRRRMHMQMDEDKMKFLINATHDIRSPLTLIMSPLSKLKDQVNAMLAVGVETDEDSKALQAMNEEITVIDRNAQRILGLVNQILDIRKIDKQQMTLHCRETDMKEFVEVICKVFEFNAKERNIDFRFEADKNIMAWIDNVQFDKVVSNIISNAFKYTNDGGEIVVRLTEGTDETARGALKDFVQITITDNGIGMRDDVVKHIFDRFYQIKNASNDHKAGTGIGLNLCKMIVDMHHGHLEGANRTDGVKGSVFTVRLPKGNAHFDATEIDTHIDKPMAVHVKTKLPPRSNYKVLVVDDDQEIGTYISKELSPYYHFTVCYNGKEGLKELLTNDYDAVISDVMMPEMDGFTMLRMIKNNVNTNHVPVVMLTTMSDIGNRLEGLEKGADAYLTKPFTMEELHLTIDNLIANHLRLRGKFSGAQKPIEQVDMPEVKGNDEQLMERIIKSVNDHLSDSDYGVEIMCDEVGISRAHLYRKMKDLTGISVSEFVRNIRLEQAARLLKEQKVNVTQVAYTVGFSSLGYFSTVFRKHFGMSPREYVEQHENK